MGKVKAGTTEQWKRCEVGVEGEAAIRSHGVGQRSGGEAGAAEAYLAGQVKVLPTMLNNRSLLDVKPAFCACVCVCVTVFPHLCSAPFSLLRIMQNSTEFF